MSLIVGVNAFHGDSAACMVRDGTLIAAAEEERFRRIKHWAGFPTQAIAYCLDAAGARLSDVDWIAINNDPHANLWPKVRYALLRRPAPRMLLDRMINRWRRLSVPSLVCAAFNGETLHARLRHVEHHHAHLASAFLVSPFDQAVVASVDGFGDFASGAWGLGRDRHVNIDGRIHFPHSLGLFYQALTQFLGFPYYGDEYKLMGLAPHGEPHYLPAMRKIVHLRPDGTYRLNLDYFRHHREKIDYTWEGGEPHVGLLYSQRLEELLGPSRAKGDPLEQRHKDLARSVQACYEEAFFHFLNQLYRRYRLDALTLAGGCAMNSVANGKIQLMTPFRRVYIQSAPGDAGGAIGAALVTASESGPQGRPAIMSHSYWGPEFTSSEIGRLLREHEREIRICGCAVDKVSDLDALCNRTAGAIADGRVVGWFQGRMEWGPRALGNRSIVCDPRRRDMKDILNLKIKRRESFRPFAPSILREEVAVWFEIDADVPFMTQVFQVREEKRATIPAVTHVDGSGRLQTVTREANPRYYALIDAFYHVTGVPMVLNTSFNENEPVVCRPKEALDCFLRTNMDVLVMEDWVVTRPV